MPAFSQVEQVAAARKPVHTCVVPLSAFSDAWKGRPSAPVCAGFRPLCGDDVRSIRATASEESYRLHPRDSDEANRDDCFNDAVMRLAIARSACDPNDAEQPWSILGTAADDNVAVTLSVGGVQALFDEVERAAVLASPTRADATDTDLLELFDLLERGVLECMTTERAARVRRWMGFLLSECRAFAPADEAAEDAA